PPRPRDARTARRGPGRAPSRACPPLARKVARGRALPRPERPVRAVTAARDRRARRVFRGQGRARPEPGERRVTAARGPRRTRPARPASAPGRGRASVGRVRPLTVGRVRPLIVGRVRPLIVGRVRPPSVERVRPLIVGRVPPLTVGRVPPGNAAGADPVPGWSRAGPVRRSTGPGRAGPSTAAVRAVAPGTGPRSRPRSGADGPSPTDSPNRG